MFTADQIDALREKAGRASRAIYLVTEKSVADDVSQIFMQAVEVCRLLKAARAEIERANEDADQARSDADEAAVWPDWAQQMLRLLKRYGYDFSGDDGVDLPQDMADWLDGYDKDYACRDAVDRATRAEAVLREIAEITKGYGAGTCSAEGALIAITVLALARSLTALVENNTTEGEQR